jgi:formylglycine-generating enzyme required for sulfatase activity
MKYKYWTISLIAVVAMSITLVAEGRTEKKPAAPDARQIVSMAAREFCLPDAIEMVKIPAGKFTMGSPKDEIGRGEDEAQRTITISKPFYMAKHEIKQNQFVPMMRANYKPIFFRKGAWDWSLPELHQHGPYSLEVPQVHTRRPSEKAMDGVSWKYAVEFCKKLTARERSAGRLPQGYEYRLPTEAEWEYACRAETTGAFNNEKVEKTVDQIGKTQAERIAGKTGKSDSILNTGGIANRFGLVDMHMGILEWVLDDYAPYTGGDAADSASSPQADSASSAGSGQASSPQADPVAFTDGKFKVVRGGFDGFYEDPSPKGKVYTEPNKWRRYVRSASRGYLMPGMPYPCVGLRPVLARAITLPEPTIPEEYNIGVLKAEEETVRESDLTAFRKAIKSK